jgi:hypothetical protein
VTYLIDLLTVGGAGLSLLFGPYFFALVHARKGQKP